MAFIRQRLDDCGFGSTIRSLREQRGMDIGECAKRTGIHELLLKQFEDERFSQISDVVYAERHVRRLAQALQVQEGFLLEKFRIATKSFRKERRPLLRETSRWKDFFVPSQAVLLMIFLSIASLAGSYVWWQGRRVSAAPTLFLMRPVEGERLSIPSVEIAGQTEPGASVLVNGVSAFLDQDGRFVVRREVPRGVTTLRIEARRGYGETAVQERHIVFDPATTTAMDELKSR